MTQIMQKLKDLMESLGEVDVAEPKTNSNNNNDVTELKKQLANAERKLALNENGLGKYSEFLKNDVDLIEFKSLLQKEYASSLKNEMPSFVPNVNKQTATPESLSKTDFKKLNYCEQLDLATKNPELYNSLINKE